jgi:DNA-binding protein YbaB
MDSQLEQRLQQALDAYRSKRDSFLTAQQQLQATSSTSKSRDRLVSVTVDARGLMTSLKFHDSGYRKLEPAELAKLIMDTLSKAQETARATAREAIASLLPDGVSPDQIVSGAAPWERMLPGTPRDPHHALPAHDTRG